MERQKSYYGVMKAYTKKMKQQMKLDRQKTEYVKTMKQDFYNTVVHVKAEKNNWRMQDNAENNWRLKRKRDKWNDEIMAKHMVPRGPDMEAKVTYQLSQNHMNMQAHSPLKVDNHLYHYLGNNPKQARIGHRCFTAGRTKKERRRKRYWETRDDREFNLKTYMPYVKLEKKKDEDED